MPLEQQKIQPGTITDCHSHAGGEDPYSKVVGDYPFVQSVADLRFKQLSSGVDNTIVFPMPSTYYYLYAKRKGEPIISHRASGLMDFPYQVENEALLRETEIVKQLYPKGSIFCFLNIDPGNLVKKQISFFRELMDRYGFFGLKFHCMPTGVDARQLINSPFVDFMKQHNLPIVIHTSLENSLADPNYALELAQAHSDIRISLAHLAAWDWKALEKIKTMPNVFVDCSPFLSNLKLLKDKNYRTVISQGLLNLNTNDPVKVLVRLDSLFPGHLLWGTDEPWTTFNFKTGSLITKSTYKDEISVLKELHDKNLNKVFRNITYLNPLRFLFG